MKCGTDALFSMLNTHPNVSLARTTPTANNRSSDSIVAVKELRFFLSTAMYHSFGIEIYEHKIRADDMPRPIVFDATPNYLSTRVAAENIAAAYPDQHDRLRFIILLRDPVARMHSHWRFRRFEFFGNTTDFSLPTPATGAYNHDLYQYHGNFSEFASMLLDKFEQLEASVLQLPSGGDLWTVSVGYSGLTSDNPLRRSMYDYQINMWMDMFPRHCFCLISHDLLLRDPTRVLTALTRFLPLPPYDWPGIKSVHAHTLSSSGKPGEEHIDIAPAVEDRLRSFFTRHGSHYWDIVREQGMHGCHPTAGA